MTIPYRISYPILETLFFQQYPECCWLTRFVFKVHLCYCRLFCLYIVLESCFRFAAPQPHPDNNSQEREQHRKLLWGAGEAEMPPQDEVVLAEIFIYVKRKHRSVLPFGCCSWCLSWLVCQIWFNLLGPPSQPKPQQRCSRQYAFVYPCLFRLMPLINELDWRRWGDYLGLENVV